LRVIRVEWLVKTAVSRSMAVAVKAVSGAESISGDIYVARRASETGEGFRSAAEHLPRSTGAPGRAIQPLQTRAA
jgi:hypothetical protein